MAALCPAAFPEFGVTSLADLGKASDMLTLDNALAAHAADFLSAIGTTPHPVASTS